MNFKLKTQTPSEHDIQTIILEYLKLRGHYCKRVNTGAFRGEHNGKRWFVRTAPKGTLDIDGVQRGTGRGFAIEVKSKYGKLSPEQEQVISEINKCGGLAFIAK